MKRRSQWGCTLLLALMFAVSTGVQAHDARPVAVTIEEVAPGLFHWSMRVPPSVDADNRPQLVWPAECKPAHKDQPGEVLVACPDDLTGRQLTLHFPQFNPSLGLFFRLTRLQGGVVNAMLSPTDGAWTVPAPMTPTRVAKDYTLLGIEHIITGYDHLLFVFGLLVIARNARRILLTVTGFTLAHSITLSLSALGFVNVPIPPVEAGIALSILFLAYEISSGNRASLAYRLPVAVSFSFGLLHGLGFASALGEIGLARNEAVLSLLFFNVGVELGQLMFIASVLAILAVMTRLLRLQSSQWSSGSWRTGSDLLASYVIGVPATFWFIDRVAQFSGG